MPAIDKYDVFETSDLELAIFLSWKGCVEAIPPWARKIGKKGKEEIPVLAFRFKDVDPQLVADYRADHEGIRKYNGLRRLYLRIIHTELETHNNDN